MKSNSLAFCNWLQPFKAHTIVVNPLLQIPDPLVLFKAFSLYWNTIFLLLSQYKLNTKSILIPVLIGT